MVQRSSKRVVFRISLTIFIIFLICVWFNGQLWENVPGFFMVNSKEGGGLVMEWNVYFVSITQY